jgi:predicted aspartyl protease
MEHQTGDWRQAATFLVAIGLAAVDAPASEGRVLPYREAWGWAIVVPVEAGRLGTREFLLDTASESTVVDPALAAELGLVPHARTRLVTAAGVRQVAVARADVTLAGHALAGVEVLIADLPEVQSDEPEVRGILGQSVLARLDYTLDHARRRLVVHRAGPAGDSNSETQRRPTVMARLGCGALAGCFVLDSGIAEPVLFRAGEASIIVDPAASFAVATNAGRANWPLGHLSSLCVAGHRAEGVRVVVRPASKATREEDGLLPSRLFARVHVGIGAEVVALEHWPNR